MKFWERTKINIVTYSRLTTKYALQVGRRKNAVTKKLFGSTRKKVFFQRKRSVIILLVSYQLYYRVLSSL